MPITTPNAKTLLHRRIFYLPLTGPRADDSILPPAKLPVPLLDGDLRDVLIMLLLLLLLLLLPPLLLLK